MRKLFILLLLLSLIFLPTPETMASPGDMKWDYSAIGGVFREFNIKLLVIDQNGNRIFAATPGDLGTSTNWLTVSVDKDGNFNWQKSYSDLPINIISEIAVDNENNVIVTGVTANSSSGFWHVISYNPEGKENWSKDIDVGDISTLPHVGMLLSSLNSVAVDSANNIILGGRFIEPFGGAHGYIYSISPGGDRNWDSLFSGLGKPYDTVMDLAVDSSDNIAVACSLNSTIQSPGPVISKKPSIYAGLYAADGQKIWQQEISTQGDAYPFNITVDHKDNIIVSGRSSDGNDTLWHTVSLSPSGGIKWNKELRNNASATPMAMVVDNNDNVIVTGFVSAGSSSEMLIISYDDTGTVNWSRKDTGPEGNTLAYALGIDMAGNYIVGGANWNSQNKHNGYIASYSPTGIKDWEKNIDSGSNEAVIDLTVDRASGDIVTLALKYDKVKSTPPTMLLRDLEGPKPPEPPPVTLKSPGESRVFDPASEQVDLEHGIYLGLGPVCAGGSIFRMETEFPAYVEGDGMTPLAVKIFIAFQIPDDPDTFYFIDGTGQVHPFPQDPTAPWRNNITGPLHEVVFNDMDLNDPGISVPSGTYTFYTLTVPDSVPDDISMLDLNTTPYELTSNIFEIK